MEYLRTQTLILSVWHHDTFGRNSFLGEVDVDLSKWDSDHTQMNFLALKAKVNTNTLIHKSCFVYACFFFPFTRHQHIISEFRAIVPCDEAVNCLFQTIPSIAPLNGGRGEMRLALRFLPQITHSEGLPTLLHFDNSIYG